jgi:hypothetical protein
MQMSQRTTFFVFVEGFDVDPYFYGQLCEQVFGIAGRTYEIVGAWRLAEGGGKTALMQFHNYLATTGKLIGDFQGKMSAALFFLDKDIDDVLHSTVFSDHIVYTEYYSVENYLFIHGALARAAAAASSIEERELAARIGNGKAWCRAKAELWKDWVVFCVIVQKYGLSHQCNYKVGASIINQPIDTPADAATVAQYRQQLEARSGMAPRRFDKAYVAVVRLVTAMYARGEHDKLFKGKWYLRFLVKEVVDLAAGRHFSAHAISNSLQAALCSTMDVSHAWAEYFKAPMRALLTRASMPKSGAGCPRQ